MFSIYIWHTQIRAAIDHCADGRGGSLYQAHVTAAALRNGADLDTSALYMITPR